MVQFEVFLDEDEDHPLIHSIELLPVSLLNFDFFKSELLCLFGDFDRIEYEDEDGDRIVVRSDENLRILLSETEPIRIWIVKEERSLSNLPVIMPNELENIEIVSHGQFGTVYKSLLISRDIIVAVKCVQLRDETDHREDLLKELHVLAKCCRCSDFIVELIGAMVHGNTLSIVLEYMDCGTIAAYMPIPSPILPSICRSIFEGVSFLASVNIMHRDLKPANCVANTKGQVKLTDFGVSKLMEGSVANSIVGTSAYMAPERIHGGEYKIESEIWSMGITFLELALGRHPFLRDDDTLQNVGIHGILQRILDEDCRIDRMKLENDFGRDYVELTLKCIQRDPPSRGRLEGLNEMEYLRKSYPIDRDLLSRFFIQQQQITGKDK